MDRRGLLAAFLLPLLSIASAAPALPSSGQVNSNSVLVALLDSHYTELAELVEKALLLHTLEDAVGRHNLTILAPINSALDRDLDPDFKRFLLQPGNLRSLQTLILSHVIPARISSFPAASRHQTLADDLVSVDPAAVVHPAAVVRPDGVIHGISGLLIPRSVQDAFNRRRSLADISAVLPTGAPEVDPRTHRLKKPAPPAPAGSPPALPIYDALAPGPSIAPAPAPGPGSGKHHFDGESQVKDFIQTLLLYGGYNEMADILVNLTSLATEMGRLVSEGYLLTVLAPHDDAMARLTADQLSEPGAPEQIMYYHLIPEYQTEESMYNAVRRFGKVQYETLRIPQKVVAKEADGSVKFGQGEGSAYLFDPDIYTDGRISVQGIDSVLFPPEEEVKASGTIRRVRPSDLRRQPPPDCSLRPSPPQLGLGFRLGVDLSRRSEEMERVRMMQGGSSASRGGVGAGRSSATSNPSFAGEANAKAALRTPSSNAAAGSKKRAESASSSVHPPKSKEAKLPNALSPSHELSGTGTEETDLSTSEGDDASWISWFCGLRGNEFLCEVDDDYIHDDFNLCGLQAQVPYYEYALDMILDNDSLSGEVDGEEHNEIESAAELLYGLIHARYILTAKGLNAMQEKYKTADFGRCPRVFCGGQSCLPLGTSDIPRNGSVKIYCPKCEDLYFPRCKYQSNMDGSFIGTTFPHLYLMTFPAANPAKPVQNYIPRVFGFKLHKDSR